MKTVYLGRYNRPDGYSGDIATIHAVYDMIDNKVLAVHPSGFYTIESDIKTPFDAMGTLDWMLDAFSESN